jgi:hypothetical protein
MRRITLAAAALALGAVALPAQTRKPVPEIRPFAGASIPSGAQRDLFKDAPMFGAQAALELKPNLHLIGTFGWVPGHTKYPVADDAVDLFEYNVGAELGLVRPMGGGWQFKPFLGLGAGARTYNYQAKDLTTETCTAGYGAAGTEFQVGRTALRAEARANVFCFQPPEPGAKKATRNDVGLNIGLAYHFR